MDNERLDALIALLEEQVKLAKQIKDRLDEIFPEEPTEEEKLAKAYAETREYLQRERPFVHWTATSC